MVFDVDVAHLHLITRFNQLNAEVLMVAFGVVKSDIYR